MGPQKKTFSSFSSLRSSIRNNRYDPGGIFGTPGTPIAPYAKNGGTSSVRFSPTHIPDNYN